MSLMKLQLRTLCTVLIIALMAACQPNADDSASSGAAMNVDRPEVDALSRQTANARKGRISNVEYQLFVDIHSGSEEFSGETTIRFDLADASPDLTIDFAGGAVEEVRANDERIETRYNGYFVTVPASALQPGHNVIDIAYRHPYDEDGTGLHRFVDPVDGLTYLYTYLWPYYANRLFPSFDQPNLKASISLTVLAPSDWIVVSQELAEPESVGDSARLWRFATTPKISTYAFSLHAGPYTVWEDYSGDIPLRLMARQSLAEFVAVDEWFAVTQGGLEHYDRYFGIPYPFKKYDQLIVPDFNIGAMENIAAVTFSENYVQRQQSNRQQRERRASVILHEMAHMWFGNLVTHNWWNGLWLNESFATQMAALAELDVTEFQDTWHGFFTDSKKQAYQRDSRVTTHPIEMPINDSSEFFSVFDDITYEKGSSVLKQLEHLVGPENYRRGVSAYLQEHAYGVTELEDFIAAQEKSSGMGLGEWSEEWLYQPGFNTLGVDTACENGALTSLAITQSAPARYPVLRTHLVDVALYNVDDNDVLVAGDVVAVQVDGARTIVDIGDGLPCPVLVNPNHKDWTYAKIRLQDDAAAILSKNLAAIPDPLARSMFLTAMFDRVMSGGMPIAEYVDLAIALVGTEENVRVMQQISASIVEAIDLMQRLRPETDVSLARLIPAIEALSLERAHFADTQDLKRLWLNTFLGTVSSPAGLGVARDLLDGNAEIAGIAISADIRWQLLAILSRYGEPDIDALLEAESKTDTSDSGYKSLLKARAAKPEVAGKANLVRELQNPETVTGLARQRAVMAGLFPANQTALQLQLLDQVLDALPGFSGTADPYFLSSYTSVLLTPMCRTESSDLMQAALDEYTARLDSTALRFLREAQQADEECLFLRDKQQ